MKNIITLICALFLYGCVGSKVQSYKTKSQEFSWGHMHAWMSKESGGEHDDTEGSGYLLLNLAFKKKVMNKSCLLTVENVRLEDLDAGTILIDEIPVFSDSTPMRAEVKEYKTRQLSLRGYPFDYVQSDFPYDLTLDMVFDCKGKQTPQTFSKPINFSMVQPVIWLQ